MAVCCCSLAGTAACQHCSANPFATNVWTNKTITVDHIEAKPFEDGLDVCPVCGKPSTIGKPKTNADRIRAMSDKELALFIHNAEAQAAETELVSYVNEWLDWLKQEVEE